MIKGSSATGETENMTGIHDLNIESFFFFQKMNVIKLRFHLRDVIASERQFTAKQTQMSYINTYVCVHTILDQTKLNAD